MIPTEYNPVAWTPEEDALILKCVQEDGLSLRDAARKIRGRTHSAVKNRYYVLVSEGKGKKRQRAVPGYMRPDALPPKKLFMNPHAEQLIARATSRAEKLILAGTAVQAALNMVHQEMGVRLDPAEFQNPDEFGPIPVGESVERVLEQIERMYAINGIKAGA